ncbi:signal peptidase I [Rhodococcus triatomae]|nr:S26 family peptidase [Rhodococcus triatomae BKS 15-14]
MAIHENASTPGRSRGREIALNVGAVAGLICVLAAAASFLFGIKPLVFRSGSMSPDIPTGALALSKATPAADLAVGDVVSVENEQGTRITHRIQEIVTADDTGAVLILKGDANKDADISPYTVTEADRVFFSVPGLGYAVSWLSSPTAIFLGGAFVGGLMVLAFGPASKRRDDSDSDSDAGSAGGRPGAREAVEQPAVNAHSAFDGPTEQFRSADFSIRRLVPARTLMVFGAVGVTALGATAVGTTAAFTDTSVASSSFTANANFYPTPVVTSTSCKNTGTAGFRDAIVSWTSLGNTPLGVPYQYVVKVRRDNNPNEVKTTYDVGTATSKQVNFDDTAKGWILEVHTKNGPNVSTGWRGQGVWTSTVWDTYCSGGESNVPNPSSENPQSLGGAAETNMAAMRMPSPEAVAVTTTPLPTTTADPTTEPTTTVQGTTAAPPTTTPAPSTTTESTSAASAPTTTVDPTTTAPTTTTEEPASVSAPSGDLAIANVSTSGRYTATVNGTTATITDKSGAQVYSGTVGRKAIAQWASGADQLWIIDGDTLTVVDASSGAATSVDPSSDDVPAEIAALVTN